MNKRKTYTSQFKREAVRLMKRAERRGQALSGC